MYLGSADSIRIESDDQGFELWIETEEGTWHFNVQGVAEKLYDSVRAEIGPWLRERDDARLSQLISLSLDTLSLGTHWAEAYGLSDPRHPDWHSVHADIWDAKEGK